MWCVALVSLLALAHCAARETTNESWLTDDIIVNAPNNELITAVMVTDLRDDKDGEAYIESGGVGQKSVTIGIKSPAVFRGYRFLIEVYSSDPTLSRFQTKGSYYSNDNTQFARKF